MKAAQRKATGSALIIGTLGVLLLAAVASPASATNAAGGAVRDTSYRLPSGHRVLRLEGIVEAPREQVWEAWSTSEGLRSFAAPIIAIDLAIGGDWEATYDPNGRLGAAGNIHNEILSYLPEEMLSIRVSQTPPGFPHPEIVKEVWTVIRLEPVETRRTRVVISMLPWANGSDWDIVYGFFQHGNAKVLSLLQQRFATGHPIDWQAAFGSP